MKKKVFKTKKDVVIVKKECDRVLKFPQISRFFNARVIYNLFIVFLGIGVLGILAFNYLYPTNSFEKAKINLFLRPYEAQSYISLANLYLEFNDYTLAKRELKTAIFFAKNNDEATEATGKLLDIERNERTREEIEREISKWETVIAEKHNYRDAYFRLAVLNYQIYKNEAARQYLDKAMALDPNFEEGKRLRELL